MVIANVKPGVENSKKVTGSIAHATDILVCLSEDIHKVSDISRHTGFSKSTVHRVLKLLEQSQMVVQDTINRCYHLGPLITKLSSNTISTHQRLISCADAEMRRLAYISEETVVMDIMMGLKYMSLHEIASQHNLRVSMPAKKNWPLFSNIYAGAPVKVLLAQLDENKLRILMDIVDIPVLTERTITDKKRLAEQLVDIRRQGYAVTRGERVMGTICVAVPISNYLVPVGLSIAGPEIRLQAKIKEVLTELKISSIKISRNIAGMFG